MSGPRPLPPHELFNEEINRIRLNTTQDNCAEQQKPISAAIDDYLNSPCVRDAPYHVPMPQIVMMPQAPWLSVVWVVGCPEMLPSGSGPDYRRLMMHQYALPSEAGILRVEASLLFPEYEDAADLAAAMAYGRSLRLQNRHC